MPMNETWIATRDIDEPNLKVRAGSPLPSRFNNRDCVKHQLMPYFPDGTFKLITPTTENEDKLDARRLQAEVDTLRERIEQLEKSQRAGKRSATEG